MFVKITFERICWVLQSGRNLNSSDVVYMPKAVCRCHLFPLNTSLQLCIFVASLLFVKYNWCISAVWWHFNQMINISWQAPWTDLWVFVFYFFHRKICEYICCSCSWFMVTSSHYIVLLFLSFLPIQINLFDRRLLNKGAVQTYAGHVNSYTHLQLGVNPSETLVVSGAFLFSLVIGAYFNALVSRSVSKKSMPGGEDCFLRIWSIKSGELVFGEKVSNSKLTSICWPKTGNSFCTAFQFEMF